MNRSTRAATADRSEHGSDTAADGASDSVSDRTSNSGADAAPKGAERGAGESAADYDKREAARRQAEEAEERIGNVRQEDIEPYMGLRWVGTVFKAAAVFLLVALIGESIAGLRAAGWEVLPVLLGELAQTFVLAVVLWGGGDLVRLLVDMGHDVRAQRILLTRVEYRSRRSDED